MFRAMEREIPSCHEIYGGHLYQLPATGQRHQSGIYSRSTYYYDHTTSEGSLTKITTQNNIDSRRLFIKTLSPILSDKQYDDGWFYQKKKVIIKSFEVYGGPPYDVHQLYPEIHERLLQELGNAGFLSQRGGIVLCLKGHKRLGYFLFRFVVWFKNTVRQFTNNKLSLQ